MKASARGARPVRAHDVRPMTAAGRFYPRAAHALQQEVTRLLAEVPAAATAHPRGLIVPHAGYRCSGQIAAASFATLLSLPPTRYTVFLLGPAHWKPVPSVALSTAAAFETPLGTVPVAQTFVAKLAKRASIYRVDDAAHAPEHSLENQLPILQMVLADFQIVPLLLGSAADTEQIAQDLVSFIALDPASLLVVSTDLSHYFCQSEANRMDQAFLQHLLDGSIAAVLRGPACGRLGAAVLMHVAATLGWCGELLAYATSGDTCSDKDQVVGYGAVVYGD